MNLVLVKWQQIQLFVLGVGFVFLGTKPSYGQEQWISVPPRTVAADSIGADLSEGEMYETLYGIEHLRLERWILQNTERFTDPMLLKEVARLKKEAENFADTGDYVLAVTWLETIWELLQEPTESAAIAAEAVPASDGLVDVLTRTGSSSSVIWSTELMTGVDLWRHQFQFPVEEVGDQSISSFEAQGGNPYTGLRISLDYTRAKTSVQGYASFKYSRDYLSGELDFRLVNPIGLHSSWRLENRLSGNSFYSDENLTYVQNNTLLAFNLRRLGPFFLDVEDEFMIRRYGNEIGSYPNYFHNAFKTYFGVRFTPRSLLRLGYRNVSRTHPNFQVNDYQENRFDVNWFQALGEEASLVLENEFRLRDYTKVEVDTFFQDYSENYFRAEMRLPFTHTFGLEFEGGFTRRDYKFMSGNSLPDFWLWQVEPRLYVRFGRGWRIAGGGLYRAQTFEDLTRRLAAVDVTVDAAQGIAFEDYYAYGPTVLIELFTAGGFILSLQDAFLFQRYPNSAKTNVDALGIYQDRNINSILLFLSWNITPRWRFTALANMDDERGLKKESNDANNTLLGFELNYIF